MRLERGPRCRVAEAVLTSRGPELYRLVRDLLGTQVLHMSVATAMGELNRTRGDDEHTSSPTAG